jgi:hypothetical protein
MKIRTRENSKKFPILRSIIFERRFYPSIIQFSPFINNFLNLSIIMPETVSVYLHPEISPLKKEISPEDWRGTSPGIKEILESLKGPPELKKIRITT